MQRPLGRIRSRKVVTAALLAATTLIGGCDVSSFIDPTEFETGKNYKPGIALQKPILTSLSSIDKSIDDPDNEFEGATDVRPEDLQAIASDYTIGRSDLVQVEITGLTGDPAGQTVKAMRVSESGNVSLPLIGQVHAEGLTEAQLETAISDAYRNAQIMQSPQVTVQVTEAQARSFSALGAVNAPGKYAILQADFRLLDALVVARDVIQSVDTVYVIREVSQDPDNIKGPSSPQSGAAMPPEATPPGQTGPASTPSTPAPGAPGDTLAPHSQADPSADTVKNLVMLQVHSENTATPAANGSSNGNQPGAPALPPPNLGPTGKTDAPTTPQTPAGVPGTQVPTGGAPAATGNAPAPGNLNPPDISQGGGPMLGASGPPMAAPAPGAGPASAAPGAGAFQFNAPQPPAETRVIRVPLDQLRNGDLRYNIVIRPHDLLIAPLPVVGEYYMGGHVARVGVYSLSARKITLKEAIIGAGMLDGLAIPQRTDLVRRIGQDREVFVRVDLTKIFGGEEPDIYLKPYDQVMVGTNVLAPFIAAVRGGFRITYGFGFLYDRNYAPQQTQ
jgi:protein involved in polysaccharide export with SLBB domain